jgi:hypothetical protein
MEIHGEKAPGPDGFIGEFFQQCWTIIKEDLVRTLQQFHCLRGKMAVFKFSSYCPVTQEGGSCKCK